MRFRESVVAMLIGLFFNNVLPARLGELAKGYVLSRKTGLSFTYSLASVALDHFLDLTALLLLTLLFFPRARLPHAVSEAIYVVGGVLLFCVVTIIFLSRGGFADGLSARFTKFERFGLSGFGRRIVEVQENLKRISSPTTIVYLVIIALCAWLCMSIALYFVILALGIHSVSFKAVPFVLALLCFGVSIPSSPGYVGVYQFRARLPALPLWRTQERGVCRIGSLPRIMVRPLHHHRLLLLLAGTSPRKGHSKTRGGGRRGLGIASNGPVVRLFSRPVRCPDPESTGSDTVDRLRRREVLLLRLPRDRFW